VLVEAQAAGLPCLYSQCVPEEADIVAPLVRRISLEQNAPVWADALLRVLESSQSPLNQRAALGMVQRSEFNIKTALHGLQGVYGGEN
jgi:hypothetical protein